MRAIVQKQGWKLCVFEVAALCCLDVLLLLPEREHRLQIRAPAPSDAIEPRPEYRVTSAEAAKPYRST